MDELKELAEAIVKNTKKNKTNAYETLATVLRIDGEKVYVHIDGGAPETPATATMACKEGDTVRIHVEGGRAWIIGNVSAPATDDTTAEEASGKIDAYKKYVNTIIREFEDGVLVCKAGKNVGALVNSSGSFDVVKVNWNGTTPEPKGKIASFGGNFVQIGEPDGNNIILNTQTTSNPAFTINSGTKGSHVIGISNNKLNYGANIFDGDRLFIGILRDITTEGGSVIDDNAYIEFAAPSVADGEEITVRSNLAVIGRLNASTAKAIFKDVTASEIVADKITTNDELKAGILDVSLGITAETVAATGRVTSGKESTQIALSNNASGNLELYRKGDIVMAIIAGGKLSAGTNSRVIGTIPEGWRPPRQIQMILDGTSSFSHIFINSSGQVICNYTSGSGLTVYAKVTYIAWG